MVTRSATNDSYASNTACSVSRTYAVNGLNQYTAAGGASFTYDANGNLITGPDGHGGTLTYLYDAENRLVGATGAHSATLAYDPAGRLWQVSSAAGTTRFLYDGDALIQEYDGAGVLQRRYAHGADAGADDPLVSYDYVGSAGRRALHADHQGSIVALTDASGNPTAINAYDEWGIPNAANQGRFGYTGQTWLPELGLWYYKARIYSPTLGRFLQTDPVGYEGGINLYAYVGNDPVGRTDPTGKNPACAPECFEPTPVHTRQDNFRELVGANHWEAFGEALRNRQYLRATGEALRGMIAIGATTPEGRAGKFASPSLLEGHFDKHGAEFGVRTVAEYAMRAERFLMGEPASGVLQGTRTNGDMVRFNPRTNEFGIARADGVLRTYFKPDPAKHGLKDNLEYFQREANK